MNKENLDYCNIKTAVDSSEKQSGMMPVFLWCVRAVLFFAIICDTHRILTRNGDFSLHAHIFLVMICFATMNSRQNVIEGMRKYEVVDITSIHYRI